MILAKFHEVIDLIICVLAKFLEMIVLVCSSE